MAKKIVKNSSNQPLYFNLPGGRSLKIPARSQAEVDEADLGSSEMALQQSRGNITLVEAAAGAEKSGAGQEKSGAGAAASRQPAGSASQPQAADSAQKEEGGKD